MSAPAMTEGVPAVAPRMAFGIGRIVGWAAVAVIALALLYVVWGLYVAGEPLFAAVTMGLTVGIVLIYGAPRFYAARFVFPAVAAILIFIVLPVLYTSYVGFTNFSARNLLTFDRVLAYHLSGKTVDKSTERPFALVRGDAGYEVFFPEGTGGFLSDPTPLDGAPATLGSTEVAAPPAGALELKDVIKLRTAIQQLSVKLPDGTELQSSGLRTFARVTPVYRQQPDGTLVSSADGSVLTPDQKLGFFVDQAGQPVAPGWRVNVGFENFVRILTSEGIRQPMLQIFAWTVTFAALSMVLTFSVGILLATVLQWPHLKGKAIYRVLLILPYAVPAFISILVFRGLFNQNFGEINLILGSIFGLKPSWGTDPNLARITTLIVNTWLGYPYMMLLGMGYLQSIPAEHYKAAALEGAGPVRSFFSITLPQILPPFVPLLISNFAFNFNNVVLILLLTRGLPDIPGTKIPAGQTDILGSFTYRVSFQDSGQNFGLAGAISTLIFLIVGVIANANFVALRRAAEARGRG
jgi:maltose/maltodextrin transport system permease protein